VLSFTKLKFLLKTDMENMDFDGTSSIIQNIESPPPPQYHPEEKKVDESQMMEFSSSIDDLMPTTASSSQDVYTNPTNGRVAALSLPNEPTPRKKSTQNPFNLTDEQFNALLAGIVAVIIFSTAVQTKLAGAVPNFAGINGSIASVLLAAVAFYFANRFIKSR
jgi:hypothetical protein